MDALPVLGLADWKVKARAGEAPQVILRKQYVADEVKSETGSRKIAFTISTGAIDRDRDTLKVEGWKLEAYRKNPVVLWAHASRDLPIARAESVLAKGGVLKAVADFVPAEDYAFADTVYRLLKGGFLRATSVGFRSLKHAFNDERGGIDFEEQELLEFSVVPVPANPEALIDAKAFGIDLEPLKSWAERTLDEIDGPGLRVPKAQAEAAFKALAEPRVFVPEWASKALDVAVTVSKRGRVLSAENETRIRRAREHGDGAMTSVTDLVGALDEVLVQLDAYQDDDEEKAVEEPFILVDPQPEPILAKVEPAYLIDPKDLEAAIVASTREAVGAEIRRAAGRLD